MMHNISYKNCLNVSQIIEFISYNILYHKWEIKAVAIELLNELIEDKNINNLDIDIQRLSKNINVLLKSYSKQTDIELWQKSLEIGDELFHKCVPNDIRVEDGIKQISFIDKNNSCLHLKDYDGKIQKETYSNRYNLKWFPIIYAIDKNTILWISRLLKLISQSNKLNNNDFNSQNEFILKCIQNNVYFWKIFKKIRRKMKTSYGSFIFQNNNDAEYTKNNYELMVSNLISANVKIAEDDKFLSFIAEYFEDDDDDDGDDEYYDDDANPHIYFLRNILFILYDKNMNIFKQFVQSKYIMPFLGKSSYMSRLHFFKHGTKDIQILLKLSEIFCHCDQKKFIVCIMNTLASEINKTHKRNVIFCSERICEIRNENSIRILIENQQFKVIQNILNKMVQSKEFDSFLIESCFYCLHLMLKLQINDKNQNISQKDDFKVDDSKCSECGMHFGKQKKQKFKCGGCYQVYYCSNKCQTANWKKHKINCKKWKDNNQLNQNIMLHTLKDKKLIQYIDNQLQKYFLPTKILYYACSINKEICIFIMNQISIISSLINQTQFDITDSEFATNCLINIILKAASNNLNNQNMLIDLGIITHFMKFMKYTVHKECVHSHLEILNNILDCLAILLQNFKDKSMGNIKIKRLQKMLKKICNKKADSYIQMTQKIKDIIKDF